MTDIDTTPRKLTDVELAETVKAIRSWVRVCKKQDRADYPRHPKRLAA